MTNPSSLSHSHSPSPLRRSQRSRFPLRITPIAPSPSGLCEFPLSSTVHISLACLTKCSECVTNVGSLTLCSSRREMRNAIVVNTKRNVGGDGCVSATDTSARGGRGICVTFWVRSQVRFVPRLSHHQQRRLCPRWPLRTTNSAQLLRDISREHTSGDRSRCRPRFAGRRTRVDATASHPHTASLVSLFHSSSPLHLLLASRTSRTPNSLPSCRSWSLLKTRTLSTRTPSGSTPRPRRHPRSTSPHRPLHLLGHHRSTAPHSHLQARTAFLR